MYIGTLIRIYHSSERNEEIMKKKLLAILISMTVAGAIVGCGSKTVVENEDVKVSTEAAVADETETASADEESSVVATETDEADENVTATETVYPVQITDSFGTEITLDKEPERVVSVAPNLTEMMYAIGAEDKLVGRSDYCDYPAEVEKITSVGSLYKPNIEAIVELEPDVVIVSTHFDEENSAKLEELNIPVITLYEEHSLEGVYDMIAILGKAMNKNEAAAKCIDEMKTEIASVKDALKDEEPVSVYYVVGYGESGDYTAGGDTFAGALLETAGGDNIAKNVTGWNITLEEIVEADPEVIIISKGSEEDFKSQENYSNLTAVKENRVVGIDNNLIDRQGYRNAEGVHEIATILHPDVIK